MPELPEVQTFVSFLQRKIIGETFATAHFVVLSLLKKPALTDLKHQLIGQKVSSVTRRGKFILIHLNDYVLVIHLRMEGKLVVYRPHEAPAPNRYVSARFSFASGATMDFEDSRKFGTMHLEPKTDMLSNRGLAKLGLEPTSDELTPTYLKQAWARTSRAIKPVLLDQTVIVGIGNIYAAEILFCSQISPLRPANKITTTELKRIIKFFRVIMKKAIELKGTTAKSFIVDNHPGAYWNQLNVYRREGDKCSICSAIIRRIKQNGRSTFYCPECQKN